MVASPRTPHLADGRDRGRGRRGRARPCRPAPPSPTSRGRPAHGLHPPGPARPLLHLPRRLHGLAGLQRAGRVHTPRHPRRRGAAVPEARDVRPGLHPPPHHPAGKRGPGPGAHLHQRRGSAHRGAGRADLGGRERGGELPARRRERGRRHLHDRVPPGGRPCGYHGGRAQRGRRPRHPHLESHPLLCGHPAPCPGHRLLGRGRGGRPAERGHVRPPRTGRRGRLVRPGRPGRG
jgi:hypothetical protein